MAQLWTTVDTAMLQAVGSGDNELQSSYNDERIIMCEKWILNDEEGSHNKNNSEGKLHF